RDVARKGRNTSAKKRGFESSIKIRFRLCMKLDFKLDGSSFSLGVRAKPTSPARRERQNISNRY
ncbi:TPA: hypothetical protein ACSIW3_003351, partial [Acinetobacter baumannii]